MNCFSPEEFDVIHIILYFEVKGKLRKIIIVVRHLKIAESSIKF